MALIVNQIKNELSSPNYFLNNKDDVRSSYYLEDCATEFDVQSLELDWSIVAWTLILDIMATSGLITSLMATNGIK